MNTGICFYEREFVFHAEDIEFLK